MTKVRLTEEEKKAKKAEKKAKKREKRIKKALRSYRGRFFKNLLIWIVGVITIPSLILGGVLIGGFVLPISTYTGGTQNEFVSEEISKKTLFSALSSIDQYGVSDFPVITTLVDSLVEELGLSEYVEIDTEKMKGLKFNADFVTEMEACIKVTASINSVGAGDLLGEFGELSAFSEWEEVGIEEQPQVDGNGNIKKEGENFLSNPKLYYYDANENDGFSGYSLSSSGARYERAFDDQGVRIAPEGATLVFPNLMEIPVLDAINVIGDSVGRIKITELLEMTGATIEQDGFINKILGDKTVNTVGDINPDEILLNDVLPKTSSNQKIYDILCSAVGNGVTDQTLNIGHLSNINTDSILLKDVLEKTSDNEKMFDILCSAAGNGVTDQTLSIGHLGSINTNGILLKDVLEKTTDNEKIFDILCSAVGNGVTFETLSIGHLENINTNEILLKDILERTADNQKLYDILCASAGRDVTYETLNVGHLQNINIDLVLVKDVLDTTTGSNAQTISLIVNSINTKNKDVQGWVDLDSDTITIGDISKFDTNYIALSKVLDPTANSTTFDLLCSAINAKKGYTGENIRTSANLIINDLSDFDSNYITLSKVLDPTTNSTTFDLLCSAINAKKGYTGENVITSANLTVQDLSDFDSNYIALSKVLDPTTNSTTFDLLCSAINAKKGYTGANERTSANLTVQDLSDFDSNYIALSKILDVDDNATTYNLLCTAINAKKGYTGANVKTSANLMVKDLSDFDTNYVNLSSVLSSPSDDLKRILEDATKKDYNQIVVTDLGSFDVDGIFLGTVMQTPDVHLKDILEDVYHKDYSLITISDLSTFTMGELHLYKVLSEPNEKLEQILVEAFGGGNPEFTFNDITVNMLSKDEGNGGFSFNNIHLKTAIGENSDNPILQALLNNDVKVGQIGSAMDTLKLYDVYGKNCFTQTSPTGYGDKSKYTYNQQTGVYTLDMQNGDYYVSNDAGIWLLICFESDGTDEQGRAVNYKISNKAIIDLKGNGISSSITNAKVRQLIDAGILSSANELLWNLSLSDALGG